MEEREALNKAISFINGNKNIVSSILVIVMMTLAPFIYKFMASWWLSAGGPDDGFLAFLNLIALYGFLFWFLYRWSDL